VIRRILRAGSCLVCASTMLFVVMVAPAQASVTVSRTNLTIRIVPGGWVGLGDPISVVGVLAGPPSCRAGQVITIHSQTGVLGGTTTDAKGHYSFDTVATVGLRVQAAFAGSQSGLHPNRHTCLPSESRWVRVRVGAPGSSSAIAPGRGAVHAVRAAIAHMMGAMRQV
jgi:hypothetical protein